MPTTLLFSCVASGQLLTSLCLLFTCGVGLQGRFSQSSLSSGETQGEI